MFMVSIATASGLQSMFWAMLLEQVRLLFIIYYLDY